MAESTTTDGADLSRGCELVGTPVPLATRTVTVRDFDRQPKGSSATPLPLIWPVAAHGPFSSAPPGYNVMFLVTNAGVPSVAKWMELKP